MIGLAFRTVRVRMASFVGSFLALALGVALLSVMALTLTSTIGGQDRSPRWFTRADVVVSGFDTITVTTGAGEDRESVSQRAVEPQAVPADLVSRLASVDKGLVVDYAGYGETAGAPGTTVHPWSAAGLHGYSWLAGGPPRSADQIVLTGPTDHRPGEVLTVRTAAGTRQLTVSGVIETAAPAAFYVTDPLAAELAGNRVNAIALHAPPGSSIRDVASRVRGVVGGTARVLTGDARRAAEPDPDGELFAVAAALLGTTCGLAAFVSIFVVAGTFGYAVASRRREFALLRTAGATPRQVRRLVLGEAIAIGVLASVAGGALGTVLAPPFAHWLAHSGFAPADFTAHFIFWPVASAFGVGMLVAVTGAYLAARRAARVRPAEALREAAVDRRAMTLGRWIVGLASLGGAVPLLTLMATVHSSDAVALVLVAAMLLIIGFAMFVPLLIPPLVAVLTAPLSALPGAVGVLARRGALTAIRRTAATAAPVLVTAGIAGATLVCMGTLVVTQQQASRTRIAAPALLMSSGTGGLADSTVAAVRRVPGVAAAVPATDTTVYRRAGSDIDAWAGRYVDGPSVAGVLSLPVIAGSLADLTGTGTVAVPGTASRLGQTISVWLGDSAPVQLRVVAVFADQIDLSDTLLLPWDLRAAHTARPLADTVYLRLAPGADTAATLAAVNAVAGPAGGTVLSTRNYLSAADAENDRINNLVLIAVLGMALVYTGIAIANTQVMATADRRPELAALRLAGATPRQVLRMVATEASLVTLVGVLLAVGVTAITVAGMRASLASLAPVVTVSVPWAILVPIVVACLLVAVLSSVAPAILALRRRPVELVGIRE